MALHVMVLGVMEPSPIANTTIACTKSTRDNLRALKQGDVVTYDELFRQMIEQYDPDQAALTAEE